MVTSTNAAPTTRLALDSSFAGLSLCLQVTGGETYSFSNIAARSSDYLPTELQNILTQSSTSANQLTHIFVTTGPGSFTGIRLGLATAEALKLVNPVLQITGLSTLHALATQVVAQNQPQTGFSLVMDAAGGQIYTQTFSPQGQPQTAAICTSRTEVPTGLIYAQSSLLLDALPLESLDASHLFTLAEDPSNHLPATPVYLKPLTYKKITE